MGTKVWRRRPSLTGVDKVNRTGNEHDASDLTGPDASLEIKLPRQGVAWKLVGRNGGEKRLGIQENGMSTRRLENGMRHLTAPFWQTIWATDLSGSCFIPSK